MTRLLVITFAAAALVAGAACRKPPAADKDKAAEQPATAAQPAVPEPVKPVPAVLPDVLARVNDQPVEQG